MVLSGDICQAPNGDDKSPSCECSAHRQLAEDIASRMCLSQSILRYADREKTEARPDGNYYYPSQCFSFLYWHDNLYATCVLLKQLRVS